MLTQDWMMRQIETLTLAIAKIMFQKDSAEYQHHGEALTAADSLHASLNALLREGRIAEGEDLLFFNRIEHLERIFRQYGDRRRFRRRSGQGDVVNGEHKGVVVNYHFSLNELVPFDLRVLLAALA